MFETAAKRPQIHARLSTTFRAGTTRPLAWRRAQLLQLARLVRDNAPALERALAADLGRPRVETATMELTLTMGSVLKSADALERWAAPEPRPPASEREAWCAGWGATVYREPKGVVLIIA